MAWSKAGVIVLLVAGLTGCNKGSSSRETLAPGSAPKCVPPSAKTLPVNLHPQEMAHWCWAASGQMTMEYVGTTVTQCRQVCDEYTMNVCCNDDIPPSCNRSGWPEFDRYGITFKRTTSTALSWDELKDQIGCQDSPVAFSWKWGESGGHMMVAAGYLEDATGDWVIVLDPWKPLVGSERTISYGEYVEDLPHHTHWDDFYELRRN